MFSIIRNLNYPDYFVQSQRVPIIKVQLYSLKCRSNLFRSNMFAILRGLLESLRNKRLLNFIRKRSHFFMFRVNWYP